MCGCRRGSDAAVLVEEATVRIAADATYRAHFASFGSKLSRMELEIALEGVRAQAAHLSGVSVLDGKRHSDVTTHVTHAVADTRSTQLFKHVAGGNARAVYQGKVTVAQGADGSDSNQSAKALLLGENAEKPTSSPNWKSSPTMSNAPMARRWAIWTRNRCSICARAASRKPRRAGFCCMPSWKMPSAEIADMDQRELVRVELLSALKALT